MQRRNVYTKLENTQYDAKENKFGSMVSKIHTNLFVKGCQMSFGFKPNKGWYYKK